MDKVYPAKMETPDGGTELDMDFVEVDQNQDGLSCRGYILQDDSSDDENVVLTRDNSGNLTLKDIANPTEVTLSNLLAGGGITESQHDAYRKFLHNINESHEIIPTINADGVMTNIIERLPISGNTIRQRTSLVSDSNGLITGAVVTQHDGNGSIVETMTSSVTVSGGIPTVATLTRTT